MVYYFDISNKLDRLYDYHFVEKVTASVEEMDRNNDYLSVDTSLVIT